jgi:hypothetical protein
MPGLFGDFVVPGMLAQPADLTEWTGQALPANAVQLLRSATSLVLEATASAYYAVDTTTGLATDTATYNALRDATCIQAAAWAAMGVDPALGGVADAKVVQEKSIGSARLVYANAADAEQAKAASLRNLVPEAARKLQLNNLLGSNVWMYG